MFSLFLKFKGGKGVATSAGVALGLFPYFTYPGLAGLALWIILFKATRYVSVASIAAAILFPIAYVAIGLASGWDVFGQQLWLLVFACLIALMIVLRHRANIARLRAGTENRFGKKSPQKRETEKKK
jgi:glycerol-3-phosphate acyltransferase PlsY